MDREEILQRSRDEKQDEMAIQVRDKAMRWTYLVLVLSAAIFAWIRGMRDQPVMDLCATVCLSVCAGRIYCFVRTKEKFELIMAVLTFALGVFAAVRFFLGH